MEKNNQLKAYFEIGQQNIWGLSKNIKKPQNIYNNFENEKKVRDLSYKIPKMPCQPRR